MEQSKTLPAGWRREKLGNLCDLVNGDAYRDTDWSKSGVPIIRIQNLNDATKPFNFWAGPLDDRVIVKDGDVLLAWSGTPGTSFGAHRWHRGLAVLNQHIFRVDLDAKQLDHDWSVFAINEQLDEMMGKAHGGVGLRHVTRGEVEKLSLLLPPLPEQQRIARGLREQMEVVSTARRAVEAQLDAARALPAAFLRDTFASHQAQAWPRRRFGDLCEIIAKQVDPKVLEFGALPHVNGENIESGLCRLTHLRTAAEDGMISGKYIFEAGDVLYSKLRPYLRKAVVVDFRGVCSADMYPIRVNRDLLDPHFTAWLLVADEFTAYADEKSRRARMPKLNRDQLFAWNTPVPPLTDQRRLVSELSARLSEVNTLRQSLADKLTTLEKLPASLLREAFAGRI